MAPVQDFKVPLEELMVKLGTDSRRGLTQKRAEQLLLRDGPNTVTHPSTIRDALILIKVGVCVFSVICWTASGWYWSRSRVWVPLCFLDALRACGTLSSCSSGSSLFLGSSRAGVITAANGCGRSWMLCSLHPPRSFVRGCAPRFPPKMSSWETLSCWSLAAQSLLTFDCCSCLRIQFFR